jgi:FAD/FMN-containing dehydrogenase
VVDDARGSCNLSVDQRSGAVVEAAGSEDVQAVVRFARQQGLRVAPQATGHGSEALGPLDDAILLKTSAMRGVAVDPDSRTTRVQAGARAGEVADAAGAHGLAPVLGLASTVGVVGLALGGGTGWLSRAYGLTANNVRAFEVVTADGERRRVDAETEPELFWAMRGGGGRFAIVTEAEFEAHPAKRALGGHGHLAGRARRRDPRTVPPMGGRGARVGGRGVPIPRPAAARRCAAAPARPGGWWP